MAWTIMKSLETRAWLSVVILAVVMGLLLFVPAGTVHYWQGWTYLTVFTGTSILLTLFLMKHDRALLERRMKGGPTAEKEPAERFIMLMTSASFVALLVVPGLDRRFGWSNVPAGIVVAGNGLVAIGFFLIARVFRENTFTSATVEVVEGQTVISTGPYAIVRHPMYASALLYLLGSPLALGSYWGFVPIAAMIPFLLWRLIDEERLLARNLAGYTDYQNRVRHRLIQFLW